MLEFCKYSQFFAFTRTITIKINKIKDRLQYFIDGCAYPNHKISL